MKSSASLFPMLLGVGAAIGVARAAPAPTEMPAKLDGKIAFVSTRDGNYHIYVMEADGSHQAHFTSDFGGEFQPSFSRDGKKIAFLCNHNGLTEIWIMNADGTAPYCLFTDGAHPNLSPDGRKVAFISYKNGSAGTLMVMSTDGSHHLTLVGRTGDRYDSDFSPDGQCLVFTVARKSGEEIWRMNVDGTHRIRLTNGQSRQNSPCFSPDGKKIAFASERSGTMQIWMMNADGTGVRPLTKMKFAYAPTFSPDGKKLAFTGSSDLEAHIYAMNVDGTGLTRLTNQKEDSEPTWAPGFVPAPK